MRTLTLIGLVAVALLAGCGSDDSNDSSGTTSSGSAIPVSLQDFSIDPSTLSPREGGTITFSVVNKGPSPHALEIDGNGVEEETETLSTGDHADLTVDLKPGTYEIYCPIGDHRSRGMEGTVVVRGGGSGAGGTTTSEDDDSTTSTDSSGYGYG